jgi:CRISPR system Cascade subunit CasE
MYLTRFVINHSRIAFGWISNPYRVHQRLLMAYPDEPRLLFRIEEERGKTQILAQSSVPPDWRSAFDHFEVLEAPPESKTFILNLHKDGLYGFRLLANPVKKHEGKRMGLLSEEDQLKWITRQFEKDGASLISCQNRVNGLQHSAKNPVKEQAAQTHLSVLFEGVIQVKDPVRVEECVSKGIGPAKGYGFGLLSLARMHDQS